MPCCKITNAWVTNLRVGEENRLYNVQLLREIGCCNENYHIYVNGVEHHPHGLKYNGCSPLCGGQGRYEWRQDDHHFLLIYNSLTFNATLGGFRLFVNGIDVNTGRDFYSFWRRKGIQYIILGIITFLFGAALLSFVYLTSYHFGGLLIELVGLTLVLSGIVYIVIGVIPLLRYRDPTAYLPESFDLAARV